MVPQWGKVIGMRVAEYDELVSCAVNYVWKGFSQYFAMVNRTDCQIRVRHGRTFHLTDEISVYLKIGMGGSPSLQRMAPGAKETAYLKDIEFFRFVTRGGPRVVLRTCRRIEAMQQWVARVLDARDAEWRTYCVRHQRSLDALRVIVAQAALDD